MFTLTVNKQESEFVKELRQNYGPELQKEKYTCPICGGKLIRKSVVYGDFFGCANYKTKGCKYTRKAMTKEED